MNTSPITTARNAEMLQEAISGDVFVLGDRGYDEARRAWNLAADQRPAAVVFAQSAADVIQAMRFPVRIAPQGTGHGAMPMESLENAMLLKTSRMRRVDINASALIARAEAGAQWQDVTVPAAAYGLAALAGSSPNVGVTGYTLGGGLGWLARRYGLAANSVTGGLSRRRGRGRRAASSATRARPRRSTPSRQSPRRSSSNSIWTPNSHCRWRAMGCSSLTPQPT